MAKPHSQLAWRFLWLLPIPLLWCALSYSGLLQPAENAALALRYWWRGELKVPVKLAYVDVDSRGIAHLGERPWDRSDFAKAARVLMTEGKAKAVGFDFIFSEFSFSKLVPRAEMMKGNLALGRVARDFPAVVLAANYSGGQGLIYEEKPRVFPYVRFGATDRTKNDLPELPKDPIIGMYTDRTTGKLVVYGTVGYIDVDYSYDGAERPPAWWPYFHGGDVVPRWVPMFAHTPGPTYFPIALELARAALEVKPDGVRLFSDRVELVRPDGKLAVTVPMRAGQMVEINWFSKWGNEKLDIHESLADLVQFTDELKSEKPEEREEAKAWFSKFRDAIVLIGPTDKLLQDLAPTPFDADPVPKVGLHGNLVKTILSGRYLKRSSLSVTSVLIMALTLGVTLLVIAGGARSMLSKAAGVVALAAYVVISLQLFADHHWVVPLIGPLGSAFTTSFAALIWQVLDEEKQKGRIKGMFGAYVSPALVNRMVDSGEEPKLGGVEEQITAYFSDIQSFSAFSEKLSPPRLVALMNEYFTACTDIVQAEGGSLDKYIGDAVVAMYGAPLALPDHGYRACVAALRVHQRIGELREKWKHETEKEWPEIVLNLQTRIGLNSGPAVVGNMGSHTRFNYTMMGDNVNIAARMESGAKSWGVYTMCTEATKVACELHGGDRVVFRPLGRIVVKGRSQAVPIYEIGALKENVTDDARECYGLFAMGLAKFYARDWDGAAALFRRSEPREPNQPGKTPGVTSNPSLVYLDITAKYKKEPPPPDWEGVYVMKEK